MSDLVSASRQKAHPKSSTSRIAVSEVEKRVSELALFSPGTSQKRKEPVEFTENISPGTKRCLVQQQADFVQTTPKRQRLGLWSSVSTPSVASPIDVVDIDDDNESFVEVDNANGTKHISDDWDFCEVPAPNQNDSRDRERNGRNPQQVVETNTQESYRDNIVLVSDEEESTDEDGSPIPGLRGMNEIVDLTADEAEVSIASTSDQLLTAPVKVKNQFGGCITCGSGKTVEFSNGSFMRISSMIKDVSGEVYLVGQCFVRQNFFGPRVPKRRNEVVWTVNPDGDGSRKKLLVPNDIVRNRKLILTNIVYPRHIDGETHPRNHPDSFTNTMQDIVYGPLFCRIKRCKIQNNGRMLEEKWSALTEEEADATHRILHNTNRSTWRGETKRGGGYTDFRNVHNLDSQSTHYVEQQQYTFGDAFCGAGGTSSGARSAGLHIVWSFDYEIKAVETYRLNYPETDCRHQAVDQFITDAMAGGFCVDILHISPPCQPFSPAHTVDSPRRDEANQAALLSVGGLLRVVKPRVVTIEQTFGLKSRHESWLFALIHEFIQIGYSLQWKILDCSEYGVPQTRRRLVIIGAGPGEVLPDFPPPTHGIGPGLKQVDTIGRVLAKVPRNALNHDVTRHYEVPKAPISPNQIAKTITTNGGVKNQHPSGIRPFTIREVACFQTMPLTFRFAEVGITAQKKQVGNAVPPKLAATLYKSIIASLKQTDGV